MAKLSLKALQSWFSEAPRTFGWDMIVAYDRYLLNDVLMSEYVARFSEGRYLPLISTSIESGNGSVHLSGIHLRSPRASFVHADMQVGEIQLVMDFVAGMIITTETISGVSRISTLREITPVGGPQLTFAIPLVDLSGGDGGGRSILLDLSKGKEYRVNFGLDSLTQEEIGRRFSLAFAAMDPGIRSFSMGRLHGEMPAPNKVLMRIMAAPDASDGEADRYGDGALIMFLRFGNGSDGTIPDQHADFPFPIAAPQLFIPFSATMIMASATAMRPLLPGAGALPVPVVLEDLLFAERLSFHAYGSAIELDHGQVAMWGCMARPDTVFTVSPKYPTASKAGYTEFTAGGSDQKWSLHATVEGDSDLGEILQLTRETLYWPPTVQQPYASKLVMIKAEGTRNGHRSSASTLISVMRDSLQVSPLFTVCRHGLDVQLGAETLPGHPEPRWSLRDPGNGGKLSHTSGRTSVYTARTASYDQPPFLDVIDVLNPGSNEVLPIHVLVTTQAISVPLFISEDSRPQDNRVQLRVVFDGKEMNLGDLGIGYTLVVHGYTGGTLDARGVYSAPADARGVVILMLDIEDPFLWLCGFLALPLPLWAHADALSRSNESLRTHARAMLANSSDAGITP